MQGNRNLVSIIMPAYNAASYIEDSIKSVIAQTHTEWELIIVDDCSDDGTHDVIKKFEDSRIIYFRNEKNSGAAVSRNRALREAKGKWVAFLDCDDTWQESKLEKQINFMEENKYKFSYTDYNIIYPDGTKSPYIYIGPMIVTKKQLYRYCYFSTITVMYEREAIGLIQIADIRKNNDYAMWFQAIEKADCYRLPECLSTYWKRENSISSGSKFKLIKWHYIMFRKALNKGVFVSAFCTVRNLFWGVIKKIYYKEKII